METNGVLYDGLLKNSNYPNGKQKGPPVSKEFTVECPPRSSALRLSYLLLTTALAFYWMSVDWEAGVWSARCLLASAALAVNALLLSDAYWAVERESLLLTVPISLQLTTRYRSGRETTFYVPWSCLDDLLVLEVIVRQRVVYFLAASLVQDRAYPARNTHLVLFGNTEPRLKYLENIYRELQYLLDVSR